MMTDAYYPEAHLDIVRYCRHVKKFLVRCVRCDFKQEIPEDQILRGWCCNRCDLMQPKKEKKPEITLNIKLIPAIIKAADGTEILVFIPFAESENGNAGN